MADGDVTVACWERGQISPYHCHPLATEIYFCFQAGGGAPVGRIDSGNRVEQASNVFNGAAHWARSISLTVKWSHAGAAHQAHRWTDADEVVDRRPSAHTTAGVRAESDQPKLAAMATPVPPLEPPLA